MAFMLICRGSVTQTSSGTAVCSTGWETQVASVPFDLTQIDPEVATAMFGAGFALFITPWAAAWGVSQILRLLR